MIGPIRPMVITDCFTTNKRILIRQKKSIVYAISIAHTDITKT